MILTRFKPENPKNREKPAYCLSFTILFFVWYIDKFLSSFNPEKHKMVI